MTHLIICYLQPVQQVMMQCWAAGPDDRPTFYQLHSMMARIGGFQPRERGASQSTLRLTPQPSLRESKSASGPNIDSQSRQVSIGEH